MFLFQCGSDMNQYENTLCFQFFATHFRMYFFLFNFDWHKCAPKTYWMCSNTWNKKLAYLIIFDIGTQHTKIIMNFLVERWNDPTIFHPYDCVERMVALNYVVVSNWPLLTELNNVAGVGIEHKLHILTCVRTRSVSRRSICGRKTINISTSH